MYSVPEAPRLPKVLSATTIFLMIALLFALFSATPPSSHERSTHDSATGWRVRKATVARLVFEKQLDTLARALDDLTGALDRSSRGNAPLAFRHARLAYMGAESLLELYSPTTAHALNGPLDTDDSDAPPRALGSPAAFRSIEPTLRAGNDSARTTAHATVSSSRDQLRQLRGQTRYLDVAELAVLEAARAELARVTTLGLAGVALDDPADAVREAAASLDGMRLIAEAEAEPGADEWRRDAARVPRSAWLHIAATLRSAGEYLRAHPDFETLDRLSFITRFANPAARAIAAARAPLLPRAARPRSVWRPEAATVFDRHALDPSAFAPDPAPSASPELTALGARLFTDPRLSGAQNRSCASCHDARRAFTDGRARPLLIRAGHPSARNTPTLLDVAYQPSYFADQRASSLEQQIGIVLASETEMGSSAALAAAHLSGDRALRSEFERAFPGPGDNGLTERTVRIALAAYLRSLDSFDSRFDRAVRGDLHELTSNERAGFTLFMGKARCGTCHFAPLFSGVMPPDFTSAEPEIIGVPTRPRLRNAQLDPDSGRAGIDHMAEHLFAFKVPTLRNVALTEPYMHNGAYATLDEVVRFYEHGGGAGVGADLPATTLPATRLHLRPAERRSIIAFLHTLTDTTTKPIIVGTPVQPKALAAR